jgi:MFS superfamily sulfate permease-like transporter
VLHLITSQIGNVIGIKIIRSKVPFGQLLYNIYELIRSFLQTNLATLIISIVCFVFLLSTKFLLDAPIKSFVKSKRFIVPWELILMILVTITVYLFKLDYKFGVRTVGKVPTGLPNLLVPNFRLTLSLLKHSIAISIVQVKYF